MRSRKTTWISAGSVAFVVVFLALMALGRDRMLRDPGTLWHPAVGQWILDHGALPEADWFSFSRGGSPWIAQQWLGELAMAMAYGWCGLDGLLLGAASVIASTFALIAVRLSRAGLAGPFVGFVLLLAIAASSYHFMPRPHLATIAGMALLQAVLLDVDAGRRSVSWLLALPWLVIVWTNVHGGALGGIASLWLVVFGWMVLPRAWPARFAFGTVTRRVSLVVVAALLSTAVVIVNPYGLMLPATWVRLMGSDVLPRLIVEHAPLAPLSSEAAMLLLLAVVYGAVLVRAWRCGAAMRVSWLLPMVWLVLAVSRVRHGPLFAVTAALAVADVLAATGVPARFRRGDAARAPVRWRAWGVPVGLVVTCVVFQVAGVAMPVVGAGWARLRGDHWPIETAAVLKAEIASRGGLASGVRRSPDLGKDGAPIHRLRAVVPGGAPLESSGTSAFSESYSPSRAARGGRVRVFNDLRYGGYLMQFVPEAAIFVDDRCELYGDAMLSAYASLAPRRAPEVALQLGCDYALLRRGSRAARAFDGDGRWRVLAEDAAAALFVRESIARR